MLCPTSFLLKTNHHNIKDFLDSLPFPGRLGDTYGRLSIFIDLGILGGCRSIRNLVWKPEEGILGQNKVLK